MKYLDLWADVEAISGPSGRFYYRRAVITWSRPKIWNPEDPEFSVPSSWAGHGGLYAMLRNHWRQAEGRRIAYIGKAISFTNRLNNKHNHFDIVERRGDTEVSCGRVRFERVKAHAGYYLELEDVVKFAVWHHSENVQGFSSLPGFRQSQPRVMLPWVIINEGYRFGGAMPRRIVYPAIGVEF
ncbi:hypothetical protein [Caulobacter segnis]|jgi:hypothetical protein|uniref:hypothetical protein n=1 Tax=Caulobacter segnis TaxID=88688 RepID=UPI00269BDA5F|nr:hypothetical protein [Caulobacter segnis]